ncbi:hypothetical protein [Kaistia sp. UC242_56]|uniref:hypothetical protein n=1 Tax=Kaistia sp. UC242_56 TaxID=3374625 RepID=UPI0037B459C4
MAPRGTSSSNGKGAASASLYKPEHEIALLVLGGDARRWKDVSAVLEREGLPRVDAMTGMRFWPAVQAFLYRRHGLRQDHVPAKADGDETW